MHYREAQRLSIAEIAARLGRSPATVRAYFYDPTDDNKRPRDSPCANAGFGATRATYSACVGTRSPLARRALARLLGRV